MRNLSAREKQRREATGRWAMAAGVALVAGLFLAWAVVASYGPVRPRLECVMPLGPGKYVAYFGWSNTKGEPVSIPRGDDNEVAGGTAGTLTEQPTVFAPGSSAAFPSAAFAVTFARGDKVRWTLGPRTVVATSESAACAIPERPREPPPELVVLPKRVEVAKVDEPKPEPPKPVDPPKADSKPEPPKPLPERPRVKDLTKPKTPPVNRPMEEPMPLMVVGLSNAPTDVLVMKGEVTALGDPGVDRPGPGSPQPPQAGVPNGVEGGTGPATPTHEVVRKAARPKSRPTGRWPDDAPPRAGSVAVRLSALVGTDGKVKTVKVVAGAGGAFDREARAVVLSVVFEPATEDGVAVESWVPWVVEFTPDQ